MWIIPKNSPIFPSAQATGALISDLKELSEMCEQSVMWRSKTSSSTTWLRRLKRTSSTTVLSTQTLKHSLGNSLVEKWTSSLGASLANHFQPQEEEKEVKTQDTCGLTSQMESNVWGDLPLFSSKMSRESSQVSSKEKTGQTLREHPFCFMSSESWKDWVTQQRQAYSQRVKSVRPTNESESLYLVSEMTSQKQILIMSTGSLSLINQTELQHGQHGQHQEDKNSNGTNHQELRWATPQARDWKGSNRRTNQAQKFGASLPMHVEIGNWATPNTMDHLTLWSQETLMRQATTIRKGRKAPSNLREQVDPVAMEIYKQANWTTPIARDCFEIEMSHQIPIRKDGKHRLDTMPRQIHHQENYRGKLNPRWVEMLMGLPIGWTMPSCTNPVTTEQMSLGCLEMESCLIPQQEHLESCGETWATPTSVDYKGHYSFENQKLKPRNLLPDQAYQESVGTNSPTPNARDYKDTLNTVPPSINKTRGYSLGQALAEDLNKDKE